MSGIEYNLVVQHWWGGLIALYLFLGGLGAMGFTIAYYYWRKGAPKRLVLLGSTISVAAVIVGILALILDLSHPSNAYKIYLIPSTSWITIGTWLLTLFVIFGIIFIAPILLPKAFGWLKPVMNASGILASIFAFGVAVYTGFLISAVKAIPFWDTALLPILFLVSAFSTGLSLYGFTTAPQVPHIKDEKERESIREICHTLAYTDGLVMLFELLILAVIVINGYYGIPGMVESVKMLTTGSLAPAFVLGVIVIGLILPILLIFGYETRPGGNIRIKSYIAMICGLLILIGGFLLRYSVLAAGVQQIPLT